MVSRSGLPAYGNLSGQHAASRLIRPRPASAAIDEHGPLDDLRSTHDSGFSVAASSEEMACGLEMLRKNSIRFSDITPALRQRSAAISLQEPCADHAALHRDSQQIALKRVQAR